MCDLYLSSKGRIFDIQRFSVHDGPGIRTIVFLKGCFLKCQWCSNPESQNFAFEIMTVNGEQKNIGRDMTVEEIMKEVEKDRAYYRKSGGGLTLSGGEAFYQPEFARDLLRCGYENGMHTAVESTASASYSKIEPALEYLDLFLLDIKHMDSEKHKRFTGQKNELILENAVKIAESDKCSVIIRVPVIPGFNDTEKEIQQIAEFARSLRGVRELHLLPYHRWGQDKYAGLNRIYLMEQAVSPDALKMESLLKIVENTGLTGQIGG